MNEQLPQEPATCGTLLARSGGRAWICPGRSRWPTRPGPTRQGSGWIVGSADGGWIVGSADGGWIVGSADGGWIVGSADGGWIVGSADGGRSQLNAPSGPVAGPV